MDPLSDVLALLKPRGQFYAGFDAAGDWCFDFPPHEGIKFTAVMSGSCWIAMENPAQPIHLAEGDCFLINNSGRLVFSSNPTLPPQNGDHILKAIERNETAVHNGGGEVFLSSARFTFAGNHAAVLFDALPHIIHIPKSSSQAEMLRWLLALACSVINGASVGSTMANPGDWVMVCNGSPIP